MRYQFIKEQAGSFAVAVLCRLLAVSRSGYYAWLTRPRSARAQENTTLIGHIRAAFEASDRTYGSPRLWLELREQGLRCGENRVARLMHGAGIRAETVRRFQVTTDSNHSLPIAPNLLNRQFGAEEADRRWVADITYIWTKEGWLYLSAVLDLFSRRVVGWSLQPTLETGLVLEALAMARLQRRPAAGLLHHSDRGSQYASGRYQQRLNEAGMVCSMSRKGDCYDNAVAESFFATLKKELIHRRRFDTREAARCAVFEWIEVWYNRRRRHSSLGYLSPAQFEAQQVGKQQHSIAA